MQGENKRYIVIVLAWLAGKTKSFYSFHDANGLFTMLLFWGPCTWVLTSLIAANATCIRWKTKFYWFIRLGHQALPVHLSVNVLIDHCECAFHLIGSNRGVYCKRQFKDLVNSKSWWGGYRSQSMIKSLEKVTQSVQCNNYLIRSQMILIEQLYGNVGVLCERRLVPYKGIG